MGCKGRAKRLGVVGLDNKIALRSLIPALGGVIVASVLNVPVAGATTKSAVLMVTADVVDDCLIGSGRSALADANGSERYEDISVRCRLAEPYAVSFGAGAFASKIGPPTMQVSSTGVTVTYHLDLGPSHAVDLQNDRTMPAERNSKTADGIIVTVNF